MRTLLAQIVDHRRRGGVVDRPRLALGLLTVSLDALFEVVALGGERGKTRLDRVAGLGRLGADHRGQQPADPVEPLPGALQPGGGAGDGRALAMPKPAAGRRAPPIAGAAATPPPRPPRHRRRGRRGMRSGAHPAARAAARRRRRSRAPALRPPRSAHIGPPLPTPSRAPMRIRRCREHCAPARRARPRHASRTARASRRAATASRPTRFSARSARPSA